MEITYSIRAASSCTKSTILLCDIKLHWFVFLLIRVHLWLMSVLTQFVVWLIYFAAQGSVYMSGRYWLSLPTFMLRNIIKREFRFPQKHSGQQGRSWNWRRSSHLLYCTSTQRRFSDFYTLRTWQSLFLWVCFSEKCCLVRLERGEGTRKSEDGRRKRKS